MWWNPVNTQPGRGTPRDWVEMGGGFNDGNGEIDGIDTRIPEECPVPIFEPKVIESLTTPGEGMAKTRKGENSELMDLLIAYKWKEMFGGFDKDPASI